MRKLWTSDSSRDDLDDIELDDTGQSNGHCESNRPGCLRGLGHETILVIVAAFVGASFLFLQSAAMIMTDTVRHALWQDIPTTVWMTASPGYRHVLSHPTSMEATRTENKKADSEHHPGLPVLSFCFRYHIWWIDAPVFLENMSSSPVCSSSLQH